MVGGFAFRQQGPFGLPVALNPPFTPDCGPFVWIRAEHPVSVLESRREAVEAMVGYLKSRRCALHLLRLAREVRDVLPFYHAGFRVIPAYTYLIRLDRTRDEILRGMASVRRRNLQKAAKDGLEVREIQDMSVVGSLVRRTFARQGKKIDTAILDRILTNPSPEVGRYAFGCYEKDEPLACAFCVHDRSIAYYLLGGYNDSDKHHGAGPMAMWACIQRAQELGLKTFDFEGSMIPAIERYFRSFGGELTSYFTVNRAWLPLECALKLKRRNTF